MSRKLSSPIVGRDHNDGRAAVDDDLTREDVLRATDRVVEEVLAAAGVTRPPVDAVHLARHLGMTVRMEPPPSARRAPDGRRVLLSPDDSQQGRQWTAAQAIDKAPQRRPVATAGP